MEVKLETTFVCTNKRCSGIKTVTNKEWIIKGKFKCKKCGEKMQPEVFTKWVK